MIVFCLTVTTITIINLFVMVHEEEKLEAFRAAELKGRMDIQTNSSQDLQDGLDKYSREPAGRSSE